MSREVHIIWRETNENVDWQELANLLNSAFGNPLPPVHKSGFKPSAPVQNHGAEETEKEEGPKRTAEHVKKTFSASYGVEYAYDGEKLIACGRVLSDGIEQAAVYNIAVDPNYQGYGLGRQLITRLLDQVKGCETILYTHPQTVKFYETLGWRRMKTGFVIHPGGTFSDFETNEGFILPEGFRYGKDESEYYDVPPEHEEKM